MPVIYYSEDIHISVMKDRVKNVFIYYYIEQQGFILLLTTVLHTSTVVQRLVVECVYTLVFTSIVSTASCVNKSSI